MVDICIDLHQLESIQSIHFEENVTRSLLLGSWRNTMKVHFEQT